MATQDATRPVFIPVVLGTARQGRLSEPAANFVFGEVSKRGDIQTELIDIRKIPLAVDDAGEALKDSRFSAVVARADGLILVVRYRGEAFRSRFWQNYRSGLPQTGGQISERTCLDVASSSIRP